MGTAPVGALPRFLCWELYEGGRAREQVMERRTGMDESALASPSSGIFLLQNQESATLGFPFVLLRESEGWEDADTIPGCLRKRWESEPSPAGQEDL